jgi:penicillin-binding protein 1A
MNSLATQKPRRRKPRSTPKIKGGATKRRSTKRVRKAKEPNRVAAWFRDKFRKSDDERTSRGKSSLRGQKLGAGGGRKKSKPERPPRTRKEVALAVLKWGAIASVAMVALAAAAIATIFWYYGRDPSLPNIKSLSDYEPKQVVRIQSDDGTVIGEVYTERRTYVPYEEIPPLIVHAIVSAEDAKFFEHSGIDYWGMVRALFVNLRSGKTKQGASTITQQVVKTFLLTPERTFRRKIQEVILARRLENHLTKEEILTLYLNQIYFGHGRYGIQEAARYYFGKDVKDLNAGEAALLAGLPQSPENISPKKPKNQARAKRRQKYVLEQMVHNGFLDEEIARKWINEPIRVVRDPFPSLGSAPEWVEIARRDLVAKHGAEAIDTLSEQIVTTLDRNIQRHAQEALRTGLRKFDKDHKFGVAIRNIKKDKIKLEVAKLKKKLPSDGPVRGRTYRAVVLQVHPKDKELVVDLGGWKASVVLSGAHERRLNPKNLKADERFKVGDLVKVVRPLRVHIVATEVAEPKHTERAIELAVGPQGAVVVIDPKTRKVKAVVGGFETRVADFNRATMAKRQPGSTFKPFVYAAAIESEKYTAATIVNDAPEVYNLWKPQNYKKDSFKGPVRLRYALSKSINTVAIRVANTIGPEKVAKLARAMGIESDLPKTLSLALGSGEVSPLELANAFATLAAGGLTAPPQFIERFGDEAMPAPQFERVLRAETAYIVTQMMRQVVLSGTGYKAKKLGMNVAGKTGTSNDARDAWWVGMTSDLVVTVWVGYDDNRSLGKKVGGGTAAVPVYVELMKQLGGGEGAFDRPEDIIELEIDKASGERAPSDAPDGDTISEVFIKGTEPTRVARSASEADAASVFEDEYEDDYEEDEPDDGASGESPPAAGNEGTGDP